MDKERQEIKSTEIYSRQPYEIMVIDDFLTPKIAEEMYQYAIDNERNGIRDDFGRTFITLANVDLYEVVSSNSIKIKLESKRSGIHR